MRRHKFRSVWISDIHLGFKGCRADFLLDFLESLECTYLFLVGDIIDVLNMKNGFYWPREHNEVMRNILVKANGSTKVVFVPGNHDEIFRAYDGMTLGSVEIHKEYVHKLVDGRKLLMLHGDEFDEVIKHSKALARVGHHAYGVLLYLNRTVNWFRRKLGFPYWSLAAYLKFKVKNAVKFISNFETAVTRMAASRRVDGVVCGHIHRAEMTHIDGVLYCNCGDWVESHTALVEHRDGSLQILHLSEQARTVAWLPRKETATARVA